MNNKDRQKQFRQTRKNLGLVELRGIWIHPENREKIKKYAEKLEKSLKI